MWDGMGLRRALRVMSTSQARASLTPSPVSAHACFNVY